MSFMYRGKVLVALLSVIFIQSITSTEYNHNNITFYPSLKDINDDNLSYIDTIPLKDRKGDYITDKSYNPFDIMPTTIKQKVEYDPVSGHYIIFEKIGEEYYRTPSYMTFEEYLEWSNKEQEKKYFNNLAGIKSEKKSESGKIDPMDKIDVKNSLVDRLFGGTEVNIKPQGSVELSLGWLYSQRDDPNSPLRNQRQSIPEIRPPAIRMNVDGAIGKKLKLDFNYDTQASFNFDRIMKMAFDSDAFSEDDIIKKIEAGNVSLPLRGNLIKGPQSLFGIKTELQFGNLRLTGILSQQRSRSNNLKIQNGSNVTEFEIYPDEYDENRHFFLSHFNRENYEKALSSLPYINTSFQIAQIEVWVSDDRPEFQRNSTMLAAIADLAEPERDKFTSNSMRIIENCRAESKGRCLPTNSANNVYNKILDLDGVEDVDKVSRVLKTELALEQSRDFEIFRGRKLAPSDYTYHPKLGFISLNSRLRPNQVLAVAYNYYYTDKCDTLFQVGQISASSIQFGDQTIPPGVDPDSVNVESPKLHFVKLLKPINQNTTSPLWDLMMKNVYPLRSNQLNPQDFEFDIFYENDLVDAALLKYIPEPGLKNFPLLQIFNLDRLNRYNDPQPDGIFDYVSGVTVIERTGSVIFPVLQPFGRSMIANIDKFLEESSSPPLDSVTRERLERVYVFNELYDTTISIARQSLEKNKFVMRGKVKGAANGEIFLGPSIPRGSVRVTAGGKLLVENQDYEIDYNSGRLTLINETYSAQGTPINVSFEDTGVFNIQRKTMIGMRAEYNFSKKSILGATYLRFKEQSFTQKINVGDDPVNNRVIGFDYSYSNEVPFITKLVDKLPFYSTKEPSLINFTAETAILIPGHNNFIDGKLDYNGIAHIDDFEGAITGFNLGSFNPNLWTLSSTPTVLMSPDLESNDLRSGVNRAKLAWYVLDLSLSGQGQENNYTKQFSQRSIFPLRQPLPGQDALFTFDLSYYPSERGPYNYDIPGGYGTHSSGVDVINNEFVRLRDPKTRWGGIMRYFQNPDFEAANYEFIEFWMLNPFMNRPDGETHNADEEGEIVFNLGNVSEDIVKDDLLFFENALPTDEQPFPTTQTAFGRGTVSIPLVNGFDVNNGQRQDLGFDGLSSADEAIKFQGWINQLGNIPSLIADPAADDFVFFNDPRFSDPQSVLFTNNLLDRMKYFNGSEGNAPLNNDNQGSNFIRGNRFPETEDLNNNKSLDRAESYYEYKVKIKNKGGEIDTENLEYFRETTTDSDGVKWYRFQIPIQSGSSINGMTGYRSIQFMRMYVTNFEKPKVFRLAEFQLLRSQWRKVPTRCNSDASPNISFSLDKVGQFENGSKLPFNYLTPPNVIEQSVFNSNIEQRLDEKSLAFVYDGLIGGCEVGATKLARLDINQYKRLQMFVHAEDREKPIEEGKMALVLRIGKDFRDNYYEYLLPLKMSDKTKAANDLENIWLKRNFVDINLDSLVDVKKLRNLSGQPVNQEFGILMDPIKGDSLKIKGNPSLGLVKVFYIGLRNLSNELVDSVAGEVWVNEMRLVDFREEAAIAAQSRLQVQMADLGEVNVSGNFSSNGYGALDQKLHERLREQVLQYDGAINLEAGKLLPKALEIRAPMFAQYSRSSIIPQYDAFDRDILVKDKIAEARNPEEREEIKERNQDLTVIKTFTVTNLKTQLGNNKVPWSPNNFGFSYAYIENTRSTPILKEDKLTQQSFGLDYIYNRKSTYIQPLKFIKASYLKVLSEFNFSILPNSLAFNSKMVRLVNTRTFRLPDDPIYRFEDLRFTWDRNYSLDWDLAKSLRFNFRANSTSLIDEFKEIGFGTNIYKNPLGETIQEKYGDPIDIPRTIRQDRNTNIRNLGRSKNYKHTAGLNYRVPFNNIPIINWISTSADYKFEYGWEGGALIQIDDVPNYLGNIITNNQSRSLNSTFSFDKLYNKSPYLKSIETGKAARKPQARNTRTNQNTNRSPLGKGNKDAEMQMKDGGLGTGDEKSPDMQAGKKSAKEKKEDKPRDPTMTERIIIRPLMAVRSVKFNYREEFNTMIPGFMPNSQLLGLSEGFSAPGWDFVAGIQPRITGDNNWLQRNQTWFNSSNNFNDALSQNKRHNIDVKVLIEPFKDFSVDVNLNKNFNINHTEVFRTKTSFDGEYLQLAKYDVGSFDASFFALNTLFEDNKVLFNRFKENRKVISQRLPNVAGATPDENGFNPGYGPLQNQVNVNAFIATYTNTNPFLVDLDIEKSISSYNYIPKPNWQVNYNGLSKLKPFKNTFSNFTIKHGYRSTIRINRFETSPNFRDSDPFLELSPTDNYYARLDMPGVIISEQFSPLLGVSFKTKKDFKFDFDFKKSRNLELGVAILSESTNSEISFGTGYIWKNFQGFKKQKKKPTNKKKAETIADGQADPSQAKKTTTIKGKDLKFNVVFAYRDDLSLQYMLADNTTIPQADRGSTTITFNPTVEYDVNKNLAVRFYFEYAKNQTKTLLSFTTTTIRSGVTLRFNIN